MKHSHILSATRRRGQRGSSILESALCFTVLLMIVFGTIDFGRLVYAFNFVSFGAREGARYAIAHGNSSLHPATTSDVRTAVTGKAVGFDPGALTVTTTWSPNENAGSTVSVQVQYAFNSIVPYFPVSPLNVTSTSKMMISQ